MKTTMKKWLTGLLSAALLAGNLPVYALNTAYAAEEDGSFTPPVADEDTGRFADEDYNDVLKKILDADAKTTKKKEM